MQRTILILTLCLIVPAITCCSCKSLPKANPQPVTEVQDLVQKTLGQWVELRMDEDSWTKWQRIQWDTMDSVAEMRVLILVTMNDMDWDLAPTIEQIKASGIWTRGPPSEEDFLLWSTETLRSYIYEE